MCLPLPMLKVYTTFGAFMVLALGVIMLGASVYAFMHSDAWIQDASSTKNAFVMTIIVSDVVIIVASILGIFGIRRAKPCLIFIFSLIVIVFTAVFLSVGVVAKYMPNMIMPEDGCTNSKTTWIQNVTQLYNPIVTINLCNSLCPCDIRDKDFSAYSTLEKTELALLYKNISGTYVQLQNCPAFKDYIQLTNPYLQPLITSVGAIEQLVKCTGWCPTNNPVDFLLYKYSNVNSGKPEGFCYPQLRHYVVSYSNIVMICCLVAGAALLLVCLCNMCICCHPERKGEASWVSRFDYGNQRNAGYNNNVYQRTY